MHTEKKVVSGGMVSFNGKLENSSCVRKDCFIRQPSGFASGFVSSTFKNKREKASSLPPARSPSGCRSFISVGSVLTHTMPSQRRGLSIALWLSALKNLGTLHMLNQQETTWKPPTYACLLPAARPTRTPCGSCPWQGRLAASWSHVQ